MTKKTTSATCPGTNCRRKFSDAGKLAEHVRAEHIPKSKGAAQKRPIDMEALEAMALIQCTQEEMAYGLGVSVDTLQRRISTDASVAAIIKAGQTDGKRSLRRIQWELAQKGDKTMLVWLGKQWLDQSDKREAKVVIRDVTGMSQEQIDAEIAKLEDDLGSGG